MRFIVFPRGIGGLVNVSILRVAFNKLFLYSSVLDSESFSSLYSLISFTLGFFLDNFVGDFSTLPLVDGSGPRTSFISEITWAAAVSAGGGSSANMPESSSESFRT